MANPTSGDLRVCDQIVGREIKQGEPAEAFVGQKGYGQNVERLYAPPIGESVGFHKTLPDQAWGSQLSLTNPASPWKGSDVMVCLAKQSRRMTGRPCQERETEAN